MWACENPWAVELELPYLFYVLFCLYVMLLVAVYVAWMDIT